MIGDAELELTPKDSGPTVLFISVCKFFLYELSVGLIILNKFLDVFGYHINLLLMRGIYLL